MKNSLKMIPVVAGMTLALLGSVDEAKASTSDSETESAFGYCDSSSKTCGTTSQGTTLYGRWNEGG